MMIRLIRLLFLPVFMLTATGCGNADTGPSDRWQRFVSDYVINGDHVIDEQSGGITHSEGQGIAMVAAEAFGDRQRFLALWRWTKDNLQIRSDRLFAWKWSNRDGRVIDENNATDGDLLIAWALLRASKRWSDATLREEALAIVVDIRNRLVRTTALGFVLLPGSEGFEKPEGLMVNPSYLIFPAIRDFIVFDREGPWGTLYRDAKTILSRAGFGRWSLPPNWLLIASDGVISPARDHRFGYDAVRIPLYLVWVGYEGELLKPYVDFWAENNRPIRSWVDLRTDELAKYPAGSGIVDIVALVFRWQSVRRSIDYPDAGGPRNYYSDALSLLTRIAEKESR